MTHSRGWTAIAALVVSALGVGVTAIGVAVAHGDAHGGSGNNARSTTGASSATSPAESGPTASDSPAPGAITPATAPGEPSKAAPAAHAAARTYGNVALMPLCDQGDCSGTQQVGNTIFSYTDEAEVGDLPDYYPHQAFQGARTSCKELTVRFSGDNWAQTDGHPTVDYLKFIQQSLPPVYAQVGVGQIATVQVPLDGGPLSIDASIANDPGIHNSYVLLNVTGTCSTPDGIQ